MPNYIYKITTKYAKNPEKLIIDGGFTKYDIFNDDNTPTGESVYAIGAILKKDSKILTNFFKRALEHCYKIASDEERIKDFSDFSFIETEAENGKKIYKLIPDDKFYESFSQVTVCVDCNPKTEDRFMLFINAGPHAFYSADILNDEFPDIIAYLLEHKIIYKKRLPHKYA